MRALAIFVVASMLAASGCASSVDLSGPRRIYGGTRLTAEYLTNSNGPWKRHQGWKMIVFYPIVAPVLVLDLPLTFVADTLALPFTVARAVSKKSSED